jgi:hypothetical protein
MKAKITFENEPERNGSTVHGVVAEAPDYVAIHATIQELLTVASKRETPSTITVVISPGPKGQQIE